MTDGQADQPGDFSEILSARLAFAEKALAEANAKANEWKREVSNLRRAIRAYRGGVNESLSSISRTRTGLTDRIRAKMESDRRVVLVDVVREIEHLYPSHSQAYQAVYSIIRRLPYERSEPGVYVPIHPKE